jgi:hypothetical protein
LDAIQPATFAGQNLMDCTFFVVGEFGQPPTGVVPKLGASAVKDLAAIFPDTAFQCRTASRKIPGKLRMTARINVGIPN